MSSPNLRIDLELAQLPSTPSVGGLYGKNTIITDPTFGAQVVRLTDASSDLSGRLQSLQTADASQNMLWNSNDTLILVRNTDATEYLIQFNPTTLQGQAINYDLVNLSTAFASTNPGILYFIDGTVLNQVLFTLVDGTWTYTSTTQVADFGNAGAGGDGFLPAGYNANWNGAFTHDNSDTTFTVAFSEGDQNTGFYVCCYRVGSGYRILNTQTGAITGQWGATGTATITNWQGLIGGTPNAFPFLLHETFQSRNPAYAHLTAVKSIGNDPLIWDLATLSLSGVRQGGHCAQGYIGDYTGGYGGGQFQCFPFTNTASPSFILDVSPNKDQLPKDQSPPQSYIGDMHNGLPNGGTTDGVLLWTSNGPPNTSPFTSCWMGEVRGLDITGAVSGVMGTMFRACHTFNTGTSPVFIVQNAICVPSQTGNFVAFTSDWQQTLGETSPGLYRGDVFVVAIPYGTSAPTITSQNSVTFTNATASTFTVTAVGSPTPTISEVGLLPSGITFVDNEDQTATLSGTPTQTGTFNLTITAANTILPNATQPFTLQVNAAPDPFPPTITSANATTFIDDVFSTFTVTTTGAPTPALSEVGSLPSGVTFVDNGDGTATLSGTPNAVGAFSFVITANNGISPNATQPFTLTIPSTAPTIISSNNATFSQNAYGIFTVETLSSPVAALSYTGSLPEGITFVDNGDGTATLSGVAIISGSFSLTITAANGVAPNYAQNFSLSIQPAQSSNVNNFGPYYQNVGTSSVNPWGFPVPGVNSPFNQNVPETVPNPPSGGISNPSLNQN